MTRSIGCLLVVALLARLLLAQDRAVPSVVEQIKRTALQHSQVMEHAFYLTDVHGARLTGSPGFKAAGDWVITGSARLASKKCSGRQSIGGGAGLTASSPSIC